jgi:hypothetical protein
VTLQKKYFSQPSLVIYFSSNHTHKTKTGIARMSSETNNSNPPGPIKLSSQSKQQMLGFFGAVYQQLQHRVQKLEDKTVLES